MTEKIRKVQQRTIESKEKIKVASKELFCEKGLYHTNTKEIAKLAGISVGNFYNYYKDKEEIYFELIQDHVHTNEDNLKRLLDAISKEDMDSKEEVVHHVVSYIDSQMNRVLSAKLFFLDNQITYAKNSNYQLFAKESENKIIQLLENFLEISPFIKKRASYQVMAYMIYNMAEHISRNVLYMKHAPIYQEYKDEMIRVIIDYMFAYEWKRV